MNILFLEIIINITVLLYNFNNNNKLIINIKYLYKNILKI